MKINIGLYLFLSMLLLSYGCASRGVVYKPDTLEKTVQKTPAKVEAPPAAKTEEAKEKAPGYEDLKPPEFKRAVTEKRLPPREPFDPRRLILTKIPVMINVEKMPLSDFIIYALGETLKVPFITDQKVMDNKEPITFSMPQPMPSDKALEIILGLFERYNLYVEEKAGAIYILHKSPEPKQPFDVRIGKEVPESPAQILQVVPLKHIRPQEIDPLIREAYKTTGVQTKFHPKGENVILLYGQASQVKQIVEFIETFDVPYLQGKKIIVFKLTYWQIDDFVKQISQIFEGIGLNVAKSPKDIGILFIPVKSLRSIIVLAPDDTSLNYLLQWKEKLDTPEAAGAEERVFTYIPRYSRASDLVESIRKLYGIVPMTKVTPATHAAPATPTTAARQPAPQPAPTAVTGLKISSDDQKNIIMVASSPAEYKQILSLLKDLDVPPRQVLIEATVAELTLTDDLKYGLEWYIRNRMLEGTSNLQSLVGMTEGTGLVYQFLTDTKRFQVIVNAFATQDKVKLLSTPRLIVLDNQEAMIQVGTDIPIVTGEVTAADVTQATPSVLRNIQYRSTGVILRIKPTINTEGLLTLNISQEVSEMGTNPPGINSPAILTRRINTNVVAAHGESIALGGLMSESKTWYTSKIPFLGDIPVIGPLFKTTSKENRKTELLIFLTPTILSSVDEASKITRDLKKELKWLK
jgi:general secretion pathway protein D